ncbi:hypothetical protein D3C81_1509030 [compost metagenome]
MRAISCKASSMSSVPTASMTANGIATAAPESGSSSSAADRPTPLSIKLLSTTCRAWKCAPPMSAKNFRLFTSNWPVAACGVCIGSMNHRTMLITIKCVTALMITWGPVAWNWIDWLPSSVTRVTTLTVARRGGLHVRRSMPITRPFGIRGRSGMLVGFTTMDFGITHRGWDAGSIRIRQETWIA